MKENALHGITGALALILMAIHAAYLHLLERKRQSQTEIQQIQHLCMDFLAHSIYLGNRIGNKIANIQKIKTGSLSQGYPFLFGEESIFSTNVRQYIVHFSIEKL